MKKLIFIALFPIILLSLSFQVNAKPLNINANSYILIESKTGQVLYEYNPDEQNYPASTTKIMTGILAVENGDPDQLMTVSQSALDGIGPGGMHIGLMVGEQLELEHLLHALLVQSANETSYVIAEHLAPSKEEFYSLMNQRALELGAKNTNFVNPCGIDNGKKGENHLSTARDLSILARHAMSLPTFREIVKKTSYTIPPTNKHSKEVIINTTNRLLTYSKYKSDYYDKVIGVKTGYTDRAGYTLVSSAANIDGVELISVIMGVREGIEKIYDYSKELLEYGFKNYSLQQIVSEHEQIKQIYVPDAIDPHLGIITAKSLNCMLPNDLESISEEIDREITINQNISAPIKEGEVLGSMALKRNEVLLGNIDLIASKDIEKFIPAPTSSNAVLKTLNDGIFKRVVIACFIILFMFVLLRFVLRRISRTIYSKK